jgi:hypothetical protein
VWLACVSVLETCLGIRLVFSCLAAV